MTTFEHRTRARSEREAAVATKALWERPLDHPLGHPRNALPFNGDISAAVTFYRANGRTERLKDTNE